MEIMLMQHGVAAPAEIDPTRPLTEAGRSEVVAVASRARRCGVTVDQILHSNKLRAVQTAIELARGLGCASVTQTPGLHPSDPVDSFAERWIDPSADGTLALVGHLPFLDRIASLLVGADPYGHVVAFSNAALVGLTPAKSPGGFAVAWILTPRLAA